MSKICSAEGDATNVNTEDAGILHLEHRGRNITVYTVDARRRQNISYYCKHQNITVQQVEARILQLAMEALKI